MYIREKVILAPYTNFKIGGPADFLVEAKSTEEVEEALRFAKERNIPIAVLGGGTNVLVSDAGFRGMVIRIKDLGLKIKDNHIEAGAGATMGSVVAAAQKAGLTGFEWAVGLPGTVGGAVYGNAGCFGGEVKDVVEDVELLNPITYKLKTINYKLLEPSYRYSKLKETGEIVLSATFKLKKGSPEEIAAGMERIRQKSVERIKEQPLGAKTAGSTFKSVPCTPNLELRIQNYGLDANTGINRIGYLSAGWLLEQAGLKGCRVGGASFFSHHANFILNHGNATASDIVKLIEIAKEKVQEKFGIAMEEEIQYIGFKYTD